MTVARPEISPPVHLTPARGDVNPPSTGTHDSGVRDLPDTQSRAYRLSSVPLRSDSLPDANSVAQLPASASDSCCGPCPRSPGRGNRARSIAPAFSFSVIHTDDEVKAMPKGAQILAAKRPRAGAQERAGGLGVAHVDRERESGRCGRVTAQKGQLPPRDDKP